MKLKNRDVENEEYSVGDFNDLRLKKTCAKLHKRMIDKQDMSLRRLSEDRAEEVSYGRLLGNYRVTTGEMIRNIGAATNERCRGLHVLAIQDTSEINLNSHAGRVKGLGTVGNGTDLGFFIHPLLAVDAKNGSCLGLAHLHLWQRTKPKSPYYRSLPIEQKESIRWIDTAFAGKNCLSAAAMITIVSDRESDIFELFDRVPDERTHILIRACRDRNLVTDQGKTLFPWMDDQHVQGSYVLDLPATRSRSAHKALMHVRYSSVEIERPVHCSDKTASPHIKLYAIDVREDPSTVIEGEELIHWRLLTTHKVTAMSYACDCIQWYCDRWIVEQLFRTTKSQGLDIESSELESAEKLEKLAVLSVSAAVCVMQMVQSRDGKSARPATDVFCAEEIETLHHIQPTLEGKTEKQMNPYLLFSLAWATWIIARLGGWKGYASERKPGPITICHGLHVFTAMHQGWLLARSAMPKIGQLSNGIKNQ